MINRLHGKGEGTAYCPLDDALRASALYRPLYAGAPSLKPCWILGSE